MIRKGGSTKERKRAKRTSDDLDLIEVRLTSLKLTSNLFLNTGRLLSIMFELSVTSICYS